MSAFWGNFLGAFAGTVVMVPFVVWWFGRIMRAEVRRRLERIK